VHGLLDLANVDIPYPLRFEACDFEQAPVLHGARILELAFIDCATLPGLLASGLTAHRDVDLSGTRIDGAHRNNARLAGTAAVWLNEAVIGGQLICARTSVRSAGDRAIHAHGLRVDGGVRFVDGFEAGGPVRLAASSLGGLTVAAGCTFTAPGATALDLTNVELRSNLSLGQGVHVRGTLRLVGARIHGSVKLAGVTLADPDGASLLNADGATIDGNVDLTRLRAEGGRLKFWRTAIDGGLDATGAQLVNPRECTLRLHQSTVGGSVRLVDGFTSRGFVLLNRSVIEGRLDLTGGSFTCEQGGRMNRGGNAIIAVSTTVRGGMSLGWAEAAPSVDLTDAVTTVLEDDPARWPERFHISGLRYERFDLAGGGARPDVWDWRRRLAWLRRQAGYDAGPYEQAARVFRQHGYVHGAEQILIAQRTQARRSRPWHQTRPRHWLNAFYGWSVGYGYRPGRVLWLLAILLILVASSLLTPVAQATLRAADESGDVYSTTGLLSRGDGADVSPATADDACGNGQVRCFQPVLYAIDTVVPLVSLDQRSTWYPNPHAPWGRPMQWWLNLATIAGWLLSSIFVLSFARLARSA
jgi:hypothetical protein